MAECHPVGFRFVMEARERGATIIHVDPRFTRTSATADIFAPIRPGTDIAFLGGLINYVLSNDTWFREYVLAYTNASTIMPRTSRTPRISAGVFSGYDAGEARLRSRKSGATPAGEMRGITAPERDETLQHPRCVFQILKRHFARYTPEIVEQVCGTPQDIFLRVAEAITANSGRERTTAFCYAVGWTQHTVGVQNIRAAAILQLLLGNIGRPGGGILALRGHATIQGSTDVPTLYNLLPGYLKMPLESQPALDDYIATNQSAGGWWHHLPKYMVSLLKAWYGERATAANEWGYQYLPKLNDADDYSYYPMFFKMKDGKIKGLFVMGENFAVGGPGARVEREAMRKLDWCVVRDPFLIETADFWKLDGVDPATVETEVFFMPAAWPPEKDGSFTNTQRMLQWHEKAVDPPGEARSETWFMVHLGRRLRELYAGSQEERDQPLLAMTWDYPLEGELQEPSAQAVAEEISGYRVADGAQVGGFGELRDDGSDGLRLLDLQRRHSRKGREPGGAARARQAGRADQPQRLGLGVAEQPAHSLQPRLGGPRRPAVVRAQAPRLVGPRAAQRGPATTRQTSRATRRPTRPRGPTAWGWTRTRGADPFIMNGDGRAWLYAPSGLKDGPLPAHYEPFESPVANRALSRLAEQSLRRHLRPARQSDARA